MLFDAVDQFDTLLTEEECPDDLALKAKLKRTHIFHHEYLHDTSFKTRNWCLVVYPDSAPKTWINDMISFYHVPFSVSPLHNKDVNPTGELKKPHYHVVVSFDGPKSWLSVCKLFTFLNSPLPIDCISLEGAVKYFCHLNNPEKHEYDVALITSYCGFDLDKLFEPTKAEFDKHTKDMLIYIHNNNIVSFSDFCLFCSEEHYDTWFITLNRTNAKSLIKDCIKENQKNLL